MTDYLSNELLEIRPSRNFDAAEKVDNFASVLESKAGTFGVQWMSQAHPWSRLFEWTCYSRQDIQDARDFLSRRQGMYSPFWVPTWAGDFLLTANAGSGSSAFIATVSGRSAIRGHVAVITPTAIYPRAVSSYTGSTLTLTSSIPVALDINTTLISYMVLARLTNDECTLTFRAHNMAELMLNYTELV